MPLDRILRRIRQAASGAIDRLRERLSSDDFNRLPDILEPENRTDDGDGGRGLLQIVRGSAIFVVASRLLSRVRTLWRNAPLRTENIARTYDRDDPWYRWELGATEKHCKDCLHLNGQIHRASEWRAAGIRPQSPDLECGGWNCDCKLVLVPDYDGEGEGTIGFYG